jgi:RsiW-degrading membrane proteinase PrsW (M82 family)
MTPVNPGDAEGTPPTPTTASHPELPDTTPHPELPAPPLQLVRHSRMWFWRGVTGVSAVVAMLGTLAYLFTLFAPASSLGLSTMLACFPLLLVLIAVDRVEAFRTRPCRERIWALAAGSTVGFTAALFLSAYTSWYLVESVNAGVAEEIAKLAITLAVASRFAPVSTPAQGAAVAMLVAAGLAFTENIAYFVIAASRGDLYEVFVQRGVFSPLAHASFAICFGVMLSIRGRVRRVLGIGFGLCAAALLHIMWNALALGGSLALFAFPPLQLAQVVLLIEMERRRARALAPLLDAAVAGTAPFTAPLLDAEGAELVLDLRCRARRRATLPKHARAAFDAWCRNWASLEPVSSPQRLEEVLAQNALYRRVWDPAFDPFLDPA